MRNIHQSFMATLEQLNSKYADDSVALTMESIAFQNNDTFGPQLEEVVNKFKGLVDAGVKRRVVDDAKELRKEIEDIIESRLRIKIDLITNSYIAATIPNVYVPHNPVIRDDIRSIYENFSDISGQDLMKKLKNNTVVGSVDTKAARVSGWFSQQTCPVFIDFYRLFKDFNMSVPEVVAIMLHELGHVFKAIVFCANTNTTNQVLSDIARNINEKGYGDVKYVFAKIKTIYPQASIDLAEGLCSGNKVVMNVSTYRLFVGATESLMNNSTYDKTGFEAMADQFASRFGYGLHLVTGLEKFESNYSEYQGSVELYHAVVKTMIYSSLISISCFICVVIPGVNIALKAYGALIGTLFGMIAKIMFDTQRPSTKDMTYDNIRDRYMRIRNQIVELIKDPELNTDVKTSLLNEISALDIIIENKKVYTSALTKLATAVFSSDSKAAISIQQQREIEDMIANDIFVSAQRLSLQVKS